MIPYDEMRPKVDLIIEEMRELTELLIQLRDHDFGREIDIQTEYPAGASICKVGVFTSPFQTACDGLVISWGQSLAGAERLLESVLLGMRELRRRTDPHVPPVGS
jgi:hypothetical protein